LEVFRETAVLAPVVEEFLLHLDMLEQQVGIGDRRSEKHLLALGLVNKRLGEMADRFWQHRNQSQRSAKLASDLVRFNYRLSRRLSVWTLVNQQASRQNDLRGVASGSSSSSPSSSSSSSSILLAGDQRLSFAGLDSDWVKYLMLDKVEAAFSGVNQSKASQKYITRRSLARIESPALGKSQKQYVREVIDPTVLTFLRSTASAPTDYSKLVNDLESFENDATGYASYFLNDHYQNLLWSDNVADQDIADEVHRHYRNANIRLAISETLLNRLVPQMPTTDEPFSESVMGAQVVGQNSISNQLSVSLIPDPKQLQIQLGTMGHVDSNSVAKRDGFTIRNQGRARFQVFQMLSVGANGIDASEKPIAYSAAKQQLVGLESKFDTIPVVGRLARRIAEKKIQQKSPETDRMVKDRVASEASQKMQELVEIELTKMQQKCQANLLDPLVAMDLDPEPVQMETTDDQIVMRYRLAGRDQMAAFTSRPSDNGKSLLSLQVHQSTINNAISRAELAGRKFDIEGLSKQFYKSFGIGSENPPASEQKAEFEFARFDPIRIELEKDRLFVTMNLKSLKIGDGKRFKKVKLRAAYSLQQNGLQVVFSQDDEATRIQGHRLRFRDRALVGTVHKILFKREYVVDAMQGSMVEKIGGDAIEISQLVLSDGWIALSVDDRAIPAQHQTVPSRLFPRIGEGARALLRR
jgi:hypothetical protein